MAAHAAGLVGMGVLLALIVLRVPVAIAMGMVGFLGYAAVGGFSAAFVVLGTTPYDVASSYSLSVVPLFVLMGELAAQSGMSSRLFRAAKSAFAGTRGSLAYATVGACAAFGAVSGSSVASAATMSRICIPEMRKYGYDDRLSTGTVAAGGSLGILIPPSLIFVIYGLISQQSVPRLFAAGLFPGLVLAAMYMLVVRVVLQLRPGWAPDPEPLAFAARVAELHHVWEFLVLFTLVVGGIYGGWFSPTEAAAVGVLGALAIGLATRTLDFAAVRRALDETIRTTCMLFVIIICAAVFSFFVVQTHLPETVLGLLKQAHLGPHGVFLAVVVFYILLGCVLEGLGMILITVPVFLPVMTANGFDPVWFGVIVVIVVELGLIHPPMGMNLFVIQAQHREIPIARLYVGALPFVVAPMLLIALLLWIPQLALWLPEALYR